MSTEHTPISRKQERRQHLAQMLATGTITQEHHDQQLMRMSNAGRSEAGMIRKRIGAINKRWKRRELTADEYTRKLCVQRDRWYALETDAEFPADLIGLPDTPPARLPQAGPKTWERNTEPAHAARKGSYNHPLPAKVKSALVAARELLHTWQTCGYRPLGSSAAALARELGVDTRSVRRWLDGVLRPAPEHHSHILAWSAQLKAKAQALLDAGQEPG